jgi:hypothetical protein
MFTAFISSRSFLKEPLTRFLGKTSSSEFIK